MAKDLTSYNSKVGRYQGGDEFYIKEDGLFQFYDQEVTGAELKNALYARQQQTIIGQGATSTAFSVEEYTAGTRMIAFSMTSTCIAGSFNFSTVVAGEEVYLKVHQGSTASGEVTVTFSGCSYVGLKGSDLNSITLQNSVASTAWLHMQCFTDGEWTVMGYQGEVLCEE